MWQNFSSAAVVIGALRVNSDACIFFCINNFEKKVLICLLKQLHEQTANTLVGNFITEPSALLRKSYEALFTSSIYEYGG